MRVHFRTIVFLLAVVLASVASAQQQPRVSLLPQTFAGWEKTNDSRTGTDPAAVDQANPAILKEYGFKSFETATYKKDDRTLKVKAAQFQDATGAYGTFTFYRDPRMITERIGAMAASANERVLFFSSNVLVDAVLDRVTAMSAGELRELAAALPAASGNAANLPTLPNYVPREQLVANSGKFVVGPAALRAIDSPLTADQIDFSVSPEVLVTQYVPDRNSSARLVLIAYPTPQIAAERLKAFESATPTHEGTIVAKRTGPLVAIVDGIVSEGDAKTILGRVNYEADVTWNEYVGTKRDNIGNLIIAAFMLIGIILLISLGTGVLWGFFRIALQRLFPARYAKRAEEVDFIRLNLR